MIILIFIIVLAVLVYFGMQLYQFDNSPFAKEQKYSFFQTLSNSKIQASKNLYEAINLSSSEAKVLFNVQIDEATHSNFADAVIIHPAGIFIILLKNKKGWISGTDKSYEWVEQLHGDKTEKFANPVHLARRMAFTISDLIPEIEKKTLESVIFFSDSCAFGNIEISHNTVEVLKYKDIKKWGNSLVGQQLTRDQIDLVYKQLKKYSK